jgi:hypothetical protein
VPKNGAVVVAGKPEVNRKNTWKFEIRSGVLTDLKAVVCEM